MSIRKLVTMILGALLVIGALSVSVFADDASTAGTGKTVSSWAELQNAVNSAGNGDVIVLTGPILNSENKDRIKRRFSKNH